MDQQKHAQSRRESLKDALNIPDNTLVCIGTSVGARVPERIKTRPDMGFAEIRSGGQQLRSPGLFILCSLLSSSLARLRIARLLAPEYGA